MDTNQSPQVHNTRKDREVFRASNKLMRILVRIVIFSLVICWMAKVGYERSGTLELQGETLGCAAEVRCSRLNALLNFPWINGSLTITPDGSSEPLRYRFQGFSSQPESGLHQIRVARTQEDGTVYRGILYFSEDLGELVLYSPQEDVVYYCSSMTFRNQVTGFIDS